MIAPAHSDTRLVCKVAAYLCRSDERRHALSTPHVLTPRARAIRQAAGRRDLLRNLEAADRRPASA